MTATLLDPATAAAAASDPRSSVSPAQWLRATAAAVRVSFTWLGVRKTLTPEQRQQATFAFDSGEREHWGFVPSEMFPRNGLTIGAMNEAQRKAAHDLLKSGLSQKGYLTATAIMELEAILNEMIAEAKTVTVLLNHRLKEKGGVKKQGPRIIEITMENGARFTGAIFVDASYEGDLLAQAKVDFTWGRESSAQYGESLAGVRPKDRNHQFDFAVSAYDENGKLLPEIQKEPRGEIGAGDRKVQAYNFRMILTQEKGNRVPFPRPRDYDPKRYQLLARFLSEFLRREGRPPRLDEILLPREIANRKWDFNNRGPFSTDYIGKNWEYPNASYKRRAEIWQDHIDYTQGLFYFLTQDPQVPRPLHDELNEFGLARDEFMDNGHWPHQLYVREARRMIGDFVMTQKDIQNELAKPDVIGMGSYNSDSHNVQRYVTEQGHAQNEGNMEVPVTPYQIPYRLILPKNDQVTNLLVTVCFSASHVTYSTLRMEPVYMIIGQAAAVGAKMAIEEKAPMREIDTSALTSTLRVQGSVMEWTEQSRESQASVKKTQG